MQLEVGSILEGKVTGITKFGAFVEIEPRVTGLVHISEISNSYVAQIEDHLKVGDIVKVKVLSVENKKIALSIKQAEPEEPKERRNAQSSERRNSQNRSKPLVYNGLPKKEKPTTFEDMLARFKQNSEEKISDIKRNMDGKRGSYSRKK